MAALWMYTLLLVILAEGGECLRNVNLRIQPAAVERGKEARLICEYDLEGDSLYSVKWYRGNREFYRYVHSEKGQPATKVFPGIAGINVDLSHSNATQVVLINVGPTLNGNLSCEVTTDRPRILMAQAGALMTVVELPRHPPKVYTHRDRYEIGDQLIANCSAPSAQPPAQLSFQINNKTVPSPDSSYYNTLEGEQWTALSINMALDHRHFQSGRLTLQCTATQPAGFYLKSEPRELGVRPSEPVPARVTSSSGWRTGASLVLVVLAACSLR